MCVVPVSPVISLLERSAYIMQYTMQLVAALHPVLYAKKVKDPVGVYLRVCKLLGKLPVEGINWVPLLAKRLKMVVVPHMISQGVIKKTAHASWSRRCNAVGVNRLKLVEVINMLFTKVELKERAKLLRLLDNMSAEDVNLKEYSKYFSANWLDLDYELLVS